jgi:hypothetical protein
MVTKLTSEIILHCKKCCTILDVAHFSSPPAEAHFSSPPSEAGGDEKCVQKFDWET